MNSCFDKSSKIKHLRNEKQDRFLKKIRDWNEDTRGGRMELK
jgi:hypothetical protein